MSAPEGSHERLDALLTRLRRFWEQPEVLEGIRSRLGTPGRPNRDFRTTRAVEKLGGLADVKSIAAELRIDASTASRHVGRAVDAGLLERTACPDDGRRCLLAITEQGHQAMKRVRDARVGVLGELTAAWSPEDIATFVRHGETLMSACDALESSHE